jgi:hypothetical protein
MNDDCARETPWWGPLWFLDNLSICGTERWGNLFRAGCGWYELRGGRRKEKRTQRALRFRGGRGGGLYFTSGLLFCCSGFGLKYSHWTNMQRKWGETDALQDLMVVVALIG